MTWPSSAAVTWPSSAAATALLASLRTPSLTVLRLSVRELVLCGAWRLERSVPPRRFRGGADRLRLLSADATQAHTLRPRLGRLAVAGAGAGAAS